MKTFFLLLLLFCAVLCHAQPFSGDYRSKQSGDWNNAACWQRYNGTTWVDAVMYPVATAGEVTIGNGHNITLTIPDHIDQVVISAGGTLTVNTDYFNVTAGTDAAADLKIYGTLTWNAGWAGFCGLWEVYSGGVANMNFGNYGSACNTWNIKPGGTMNFLNVTGYINSLTINNEGTMNFTPGASGMHLKNNLVTEADAGVINNLSTGIININTGFGFTLGFAAENNLALNNSGIININSASGLAFWGDRSFNNSGTIHIAANAALAIYTLFNWNGGGFTGTGKIISHNGWHNNVAGALPQGITLDLYSGDYDGFGGPAELTINGVVNIMGTISNFYHSSDVARVKIGTTGIANIPDNNAMSIGKAVFTNNGVFNFLSTSSETGLNMFEGSQFINNGQVKVHGTGDSYLFGESGDSFINNGSFEILAGGSFDAVYIDGEVVFRNMSTGSIKGNGFIYLRNSFVNSGSIEPGASPGILNTVTAPNLLQANSTLKIEVAGNSGPGSGHDQLISSSSLQLAGRLVVTELPGTINNGVFEIIRLNSGTISGSFSNVQLPPFYTVSVSSNRVSLIKSIVLPLRFISFTALPVNNHVSLNWATDNEINTSHFTIERSTDGNNFEAIGNVPSQNASGQHSYHFTDAAPFAGTGYYRIKQVDADGRFSFSETRVVKMITAKAQLYPTVTQDFINIKMAGSYLVQLYDMNGKILLAKNERDTNVFDLRNFSAGSYIIRISNDRSASSYKVIKQ